MNILAAVAAFVIGLISSIFGVKSLSTNDVKTTPPVLLEVTSSPAPDPTENWKTYSNRQLGFSFRYPPDWVLDATADRGDEQGHNVEVRLTRGKTKIHIFADMVGIGGVGRDYTGVPTQVDGVKLYVYSVDQAETQTTFVGLTDRLTESLGVFEAYGKTYSIALLYPNTYTPNQASAVEGEFEQILSTFVFGK